MSCKTVDSRLSYPVDTFTFVLQAVSNMGDRFSEHGELDSELDKEIRFFLCHGFNPGQVIALVFTTGSSASLSRW